MPYFRGPQRALMAALGLSLLLLADGLSVAPGHVVSATDDSTLDSGPLEDVSSYSCTSGFDDIDSKVEMSLHGVTLLDRGAVAVGYARRQNPLQAGRRRPATLINRGGAWRRVYAGSPGDEDGLMAVASRKSGNAWAVGFTTIGGRVMPLALRWNGRTWKTDRPRPRTRSPLASVLTDVTLVGRGKPFAVGYRETASGKRRPIAVRKDGRRWRYLPIRIDAHDSVTLTGVSSDRRGGTWAVGHGGLGAEIKPVVFRRSGNRWQRLRVPHLKGEAALTDVVGIGRRQSLAVGYHRHAGRSEPLVLSWNGHKWQKAPAPAFASNDVMLSAVTADPAGGIWVVGTARDDERKRNVAVAAWWDGQAWNEVSGPGGGTELYDVIGSLSGEGWAVGRSGRSSRAARVCTPAQSGVFGGSQPGVAPSPPSGLVAAHSDESSTVSVAGSTGSDEAAAASPTDLTAATPDLTAAQDEPTAQAKGRVRRARAIRVRTGSLPVARADEHIVARNVAREAGVYEDTATYGAVVADFDGDGTDDLFIGRHGHRGRLLLNRDGTFVEHRALKMPAVDRHGCAAADVDGSGLPDLYCAVGAMRGTGLKSNELWLDPGGPAPVEVATERGLSDPAGRGRVSAFLEADKEGATSLVVTNAPLRPDGLPSIGRRFLIDEGGSFRAKNFPGFAPQLGALALQDADYDADGREDLLLVTGGAQAPQRAGTWLYRSTPRGLVDVTRKVGIGRFDAVDAELVDVNGDGKLDLVQLSETRLRVSTLRKGKFRKVYERRLTHGRAIAGGDINGDGKGDLYVVRGNAKRNYPDVMLVNRNGGSRWSSLLIPQVSRGNGDDAFAIDHDGNGLDDFLVLNGRNTRGPNELIAFYRRGK